MPNMSLHDIQQMYSGSIINYEDVPVYIEMVETEERIYLKELRTGKSKIVKFEMEKFTPCCGRLGMFNYNGCAVYISRRPIRRWSAGVHPGNIAIKRINSPFSNGARVTESRIQAITNKEWADCVEGKYPTLNMAAKTATQAVGVIAFDRQFAIDAERTIFYKSKGVGTLPPNGRKIDDIVFNENWEHLILLLKVGYENGCGDFKPSKG